MVHLCLSRSLAVLNDSMAVFTIYVFWHRVCSTCFFLALLYYYSSYKLVFYIFHSLNFESWDFLSDGNIYASASEEARETKVKELKSTH